MTNESEDPNIDVCRRMAALIRRLGGTITARQLGRRSWRFRQVPRSVLGCMVKAGFGRWEDQPPGPRGGRPTRIFVLSEQNGEAAASPNALSPASPNAGAGSAEIRDEVDAHEVSS